MSFLRSPTWVVIRRSALVLILVILVYRNFGGSIAGWFRTPGPSEEIRITHEEFRRDVPDGLPAWFIGLENRSGSTTYENILLEATYSDGEVVIERGELRIEQRLFPGQEVLIGSPDTEMRDGATEGWVRVVGADIVE